MALKDSLSISWPMKSIRPFDEIMPRERQPERRLARAGFADDAERLAGAHGDVDAVDRLHMVDRLAEEALLDRKPDLDVVDPTSPSAQPHSAAGGLPFGSAASRWRV